MERLKSSIRSLQEAITSMKPNGPMFSQEARTQTFREDDLYSSYQCPCITSSTTSFSSFSDPSKPVEGAEYLQVPTIDLMPLASYLEEDLLCSNSTTTMSSSKTTEQSDYNWRDAIPKGPISSKRFFFSPHTTKSIMEEAAPHYCKTLPEASFCEDSLAVAMASDDPFQDFRASMAEMVTAHELRGWQCLQELLHCYLRLNEKRNHKIIVLAFADVIMQLMSQDKASFSDCFPSHLQLLDCNLDQ